MKAHRTARTGVVLLFGCAVMVWVLRSPPGGSRSYGFEPEGRPEWRGSTFDVRQFGAACDGRADDTLPVLRAVAAAKKAGGGQVLVPGRCVISRPIILPRTGEVPVSAVRLRGTDMLCAGLFASRNFPPNRALIEWETPTSDSSANRMMGQSIRDLTLALPVGVPGVKAVFPRPFTDLSTLRRAMNEWLQLDLLNVRIECENTDNEVLIDLPVGARGSTWENVAADPWRGPKGPKYATLLFRVGSRLYDPSGYIGEDSSGFGLGRIANVSPMGTRGGYCRTFEGRIYMSTFSGCFDNGTWSGSDGIAYHFINSCQVNLLNLASEGGGGRAFVFERCRDFEVMNLTAGIPYVTDFGDHQTVRDSVTLMGCEGMRFRTHYAADQSPSCSSKGVRAVVMDAACRDCLLENWEVRGDLTAPFNASAAAAAEREIRIAPEALVHGCRATGSVTQAFEHQRQPYRLGSP